MIASGRPLLILGTSHVGKSTLAGKLAQLTGRDTVSTDQLGRHPGRPWTGVPEAVLDFYLRLPDTAISWFLAVHHDNMVPVIRTCLETPALILEGSALRPRHFGRLGIAPDTAICLTAAPETIAARIEASANAAKPSPPVAAATNGFLRRSLTDNDALLAEAETHGVDIHATDGPGALDHLTQRLVGSRP